jgi:electron transport complex protein RnfB
MQNRREFLNMLSRGAIFTGLAAGTGLLIYRSSANGSCRLGISCTDCKSQDSCPMPHPDTLQQSVWQLDPSKCIQCGRCAENCVVTPSAVKVTHVYAMCGYCDLCGGYLKPGTKNISTAAEAQLCPTSAIRRKFVEDPFYEYTIDEDLCIGCGKCVKGCSAFGNGSLQLQVHHDICVNCNQCSIATHCPADAFSRVSVHTPYLLQGFGGQPAEAHDNS